MGMSRQEFDNWTGGMSDREIDALLSELKKRYHKFLLISLIPIVSIFTMGIAIFCYNNIVLLKSRGRSTGSWIWRFILLIYGLIIIPYLEILLFSHITFLGEKALGW